MLTIISPAKTLDFESAVRSLPVSQPHLVNDSCRLIDICRQLSLQQIASLMSISDKLAGLNAARFGMWRPEHDIRNSRAAIFAFKGDVYTGLDVEQLSDNDLQFAQSHLRILSGLYGLLKPLDLIQPYRLEMGIRLANSRGKDLYAFWYGIITKAVQDAIDEQNDDILINLASDEYYKSIQQTKLRANIIKPIFLDQKNGTYKVISFYAKKARGMMCRFIIQQRIKEIAHLKEFNLGGYWFDKMASSAHELIFKRDLHE